TRWTVATGMRPVWQTPAARPASRSTASGSTVGVRLPRPRHAQEGTPMTEQNRPDQPDSAEPQHGQPPSGQPPPGQPLEDAAGQPRYGVRLTPEQLAQHQAQQPSPGAQPGQPDQPGQSGYPSPAYGQPPYGQPGQSPYGQPGQSPYGQPGQPPYP